MIWILYGSSRSRFSILSNACWAEGQLKELMNTRSNHNLAILMAFTILLAIACNSGTYSPTSTPALLHFDNEVVAFDYMEGMDLFTGADAAVRCVPDFQLGGELVVGFGDDHAGSLSPG